MRAPQPHKSEPDSRLLEKEQRLRPADAQHGARQHTHQQLPPAGRESARSPWIPWRWIDWDHEQYSGVTIVWCDWILLFLLFVFKTFAYRFLLLLALLFLFISIAHRLCMFCLFFVSFIIMSSMQTQSTQCEETTRLACFVACCLPSYAVSFLPQVVARTTHTYC